MLVVVMDQSEVPSGFCSNGWFTSHIRSTVFKCVRRFLSEEKSVQTLLAAREIPVVTLVDVLTPVVNVLALVF